jgi:hypothetical protein
MTRLLGVAALGAATVALAAGTATASPDLGSRVLASPLSFAVDPLQEELQISALASSNSPGTKHVGPVASSSPDSGTCGNDWAQDQFDRFFTIRQTGPATYTVYEQFKNGTFVTNTGLSPGACDLSDGYGPGTIDGGLTGTMHGYLIANVVCADPLTPCLDPAAACEEPLNPCDTTTGFLNEFFPGATFDTDTYFFHYAGNDGTNTALVVHEWKNASCNRGGNHGDIASASTTTNPFAISTCP